MQLYLFTCHGRPLKDASPEGDEHYAYSYLVKYGYMSEESSLESSKLQSLSQAVADFQSFAGLNMTGDLDKVTMDMMKKRSWDGNDIFMIMRATITHNLNNFENNPK